MSTSPIAAQLLIDPDTASAEIDLDALRANVAVLAGHVGDAALMVVVKADGYGHGMVPCAEAAREAGAQWLGTATPGEALALRSAGDQGPLLAWLYGPADDLAAPVAADVDLAAHHPSQITRLSAAAEAAGRPARVHLKIDTGLSRNGCRPELWPELCAAATEAERAGLIEVTAVWSHFACADEPGHPSVGRQLDAFAAAEKVAREVGLRPRLRHLANSAGAMIVPDSQLDLVRVGIASYGIEPAPGLSALARLTLTPVMRLRARLVNVKRVEAGDAVSYGHTWTADRPTVLGVVPLGYGDGIPRHASNRAFVGWHGVRVPVRGRVCMDQFVVDLGPDADARIGDEVVLFGSGADGEPTAGDWAEWCDTIGYEIVTRIGARVPRSYSPPGPRTTEEPTVTKEKGLMGKIAEGIGLLAGVAALAVGGAAAGMELERRVVSKRIWKDADDSSEDFFGLRSSGPQLVTPDGVVLHTELDPPEDEGDPANTPTVVLVHGYALSLDCWHFQRKHLRGRYPVVLYDQRSHGRSSRSDPELCRIGQLAEDLHQVLGELTEAGRPLVLIGHSMGGMTIMRLARTHPEWFSADAPDGRRVRGVGLVYTSSGQMADYSPIKGLPGRAFSRVAQPVMAGLNRIPELVEKGRRAGSDIGFVVTKRMAFGSDVPVSYVEFVSTMLGATPLEVVADFYPAFADLDEAKGLRRLRDIETVVIGGEQDMILPIQHTDKIIEQLPDAVSRRMSDCGHLGMIEHAASVNRLLDGLIGRCVGAD